MRDELPTAADPTALAVEPTPRDRTLVAVYLGPESGGGTRIVQLPEGAEITFGRSRVATVPIDSERVSRLHARIARRGGRVTVEDLGSRNGTRVNGSKIDGATELTSGDQIEVGPVTAVVSTSSAAAARRPRIGSAAHLEDRLRAETDRGNRYRRTVGLLMVRLDGPLEAMDAAVACIASELRPMDTVAEYGPDDIAVLAPELDEAELEATARRLVEAARRAAPAAGLRIGLAQFPRHGAAPDELIERARAALRTARGGPDAIVAAPAPEARAMAGDLVIADPQMRRVYALVDRVADSTMTVLVVGETGVGKEVVAESLHRRSARRDRSFVRLNCACLPEGLLESELFGHERGAFTGAERRRTGYFEAADGGTIFLDEIGEISPGVQAKLLRVLEERTLTRVGGTQEISVDVRVVCATNRDLEAEVARGAFREDLFFRISAFTILVPPLRDRRAEIIPLAEHVLAGLARESGQAAPRLSPAARAALERYAWPGNVRELRNAVERAMVLQSAGVIELEDLPDRLREEPPPPGVGTVAVVDGGEIDVRQQVADVERATIQAALDACGGNQTHAARRLGLSRRALIYRMEKHGLKPAPGGGRGD